MRTQPGRPWRIPLGPFGFWHVDLTWTWHCLNLAVQWKKSRRQAARDLAAADAAVLAEWEAMTPDERAEEDRQWAEWEEGEKRPCHDCPLRKEVVRP